MRQRRGGSAVREQGCLSDSQIWFWWYDISGDMISLVKFLMAWYLWWHSGDMISLVTFWWHDTSGDIISCWQGTWVKIPPSQINVWLPKREMGWISVWIMISLNIRRRKHCDIQKVGRKHWWWWCPNLHCVGCLINGRPNFVDIISCWKKGEEGMEGGTM